MDGYSINRYALRRLVRCMAFMSLSLEESLAEKEEMFTIWTERPQFTRFLEIKPTVLQFTETLGLGSDSEAIRFNLQRT